MKPPPRDKRPLKQLGSTTPYHQHDPHAVQEWLKETHDVLRLKPRNHTSHTPTPATHTTTHEAPHGNILDLHGMSRDQAYRTLLRFMHGASQQQRKKVRIITGKGRGVLQHDVPLWLESMPQVAHIEQASQAHGGAGAFYVTLQWS